MSSGSTASQDRRIVSIAELLGIVGPIVIGLGGVALRLDAFLRNYALTLDEAALARNIIDRPWTRLLGWLDYAQLAPPGFLVVEKAIVSVFGTSEYALRLFPFGCNLVSLWLCWMLCRRLLSVVPALLAFTLFSLNTSMIEYATRAKPYGGDIAASLLVLLLATWLFEPSLTRRKAVAIGLAGGLTSLFSFASVLVLAAVALVMLNRARRECSARTGLLIAAVIWAFSAGSGALVAMSSQSPADAAYLHAFWQPAFMPFPPRSTADLLWVGHQLKATIRWTLEYRASVFWIATAGLGVWSFSKRRQSDAALILMMPLIVVVAASAAGKYPFGSGRLTLFLAPMLLILVAEGADWFRRTFASRPFWVGATPMMLLLALGLHGTWNGWHIRRNGDLRSVFTYVRDHWQSDDRLFVHYTAAQNFFYYAPRFGFKSGDYVIGSCSDDARRTALWDVERFRGRARVWVAVWATDQNELLFRYLTRTATVRDAFSIDKVDPTKISLMGGAAILYDLSTPTVVNPATFTTPESPGQAEDSYACYGVFRAIGD